LLPANAGGSGDVVVMVTAGWIEPVKASPFLNGVPLLSVAITEYWYDTSGLSGV
jgi:hypothetical protein